MMKKKICLLGDFAVGKTSLVQRFVKSLFSEKYLTTLGVKIDKKTVSVHGQEVYLLLWDLAGEDEFIKVRMSYLRGSAGIALVVDGSRPETLNTAVTLLQRVEQVVGRLPFVVFLNKADLTGDWRIEEESLSTLKNSGWQFYETSAKSGQNVEKAFQALATAILEA